jgi:hypothetical protein
MSTYDESVGRYEDFLPPAPGLDQLFEARQIAAARRLSFVSLIPEYETPEGAARQAELVPALLSSVREQVESLPGKAFHTTIYHTSIEAGTSALGLDVYFETKYANESVRYRYRKDRNGQIRQEATNNPFSRTGGLKTVLAEDKLQPRRTVAVLKFLSGLMEA